MKRIGDDLASPCERDRRADAFPSATPLPRQPPLAPASRRSAGATAGSRSNKRMQQPSALGGGAHRRQSAADPRPRSSPSDEGASGRGGRASTGAGRRHPVRQRQRTSALDFDPRRRRRHGRLCVGTRAGEHPRLAVLVSHHTNVRVNARGAGGMPAERRRRLGGLRRGWPSAPASTKPLLGTRRGDVEQPPMLLQSRRASAGVEQFADRAVAPRPSRGRNTGTVRALPRRDGPLQDRSALRPRRDRCGGIGQDHHRRLEPLGAMRGHHPHRVERCGWDRA